MEKGGEIDYWRFTFLQHQRSFQDRQQLVTLHARDNYIALTNWEIRLQYPTQSHYLGVEQTSPCPILVIPSVRLGSNMHPFLSH